MGAAGNEILRDVGPQDVDRAGELVKRVGVHNQGRRLILAVQSSRPEKLTTYSQWPEDYERSEQLDRAEVEQVVSDRFDDVESVEGARVQGANLPVNEKVVVAVVIGESGRSFRVAVPYSEFGESIDAYDEAVVEGRTLEDGSADGQLTQTRSKLREATSGKREAEQEAAAAEQRAAEAEARAASLEERLAAIEARINGEAPADPAASAASAEEDPTGTAGSGDDFDAEQLIDGTLPEVKARLKSLNAADDLPEHRLDAIEAAEQARPQTRDGVLKAVGAIRDSRSNS